MKHSDGNSADVSRQGAFSRALHSIRTRYSISTAVFLLAMLALFYVGGRVVLVHLVRDAEQQVKEIGSDLSRIAYRDAERARSRIVAGIAAARTAAAGLKPRDMVAPRGGSSALSLAVSLSAAGEPGEGFCRDSKGDVVAVPGAWLAPYRETLAVWCQSLSSGQGGESTPVGLLRLAGRQHYVTICRDGGGFVAAGVPFEADEFARSMSDGRSGMSIRVTNRKSDVVQTRPRRAADDGKRNGYGFAPLFSEAASFYSGGFWDLDAVPFEAVFAVRDIVGNAITMIAVSLPRSLSSVATIAISRLTFFIALAGMLVVLPIFWIQGRILLNPLSRMTRAVLELGERHQSEGCPRLEWEGKDEFAVLAASVNRMLETVSARSLAIAQIEQRHKALIGGLPDAVAIFDARGRLVTVSKEAEGVAPLPGLRHGEPLDAAVFGAAGTARFARTLADTMSTGAIGKVRLDEQRQPAGASRHFELRLTRMDEHFALVIVRDVSAEVAEHSLRIEAEQRAMDISKRESLTALAAGIAHDMNNVLSVMLQAAEAADADSDESSSARALDVIRDAVRRGASMMRELTAFAGENKITLMRAHPRLVVEDVRQLSSHLVGDNIVLTIGADDSAPDVDVDPNQFWKVLFNIVKNASEAIGTRPGHIDLSASPFEMTREEAASFVAEHPLNEGPGVLFCIRDDGPGIAPHILGRIFDPYVSSKSLGRGLGLATVRTIVEAHGGGIRVRSRLDAGTTFQIFLPASTLSDSAAPPQKSEGGEGEAGSLSGDVLVVDNDEAILKTTSILLKALGLRPRTACDRREALAVVRRHAPHLRAILLDAHLGGIDTVRLLRAFRVGAPQVPVIVSSGSSEEEIAKMFDGHRYDAFLAKPYTLAELKRACLSVGRK